jgi:TolB-like protein/DNA-binding winged helix-turn-helix (wHTH) protein/Tfp pilus assembly protein PilF
MNDVGMIEQPSLYEFGDYRLDAGRRLLYRKGQTAALSVKPKVLEALLYFVEHPGQLLDKDQLLAALWPGLVVEENGLTQLVSTLRRVLGESPGENRYLVTVSGRGYRFVANVAHVPQPSVPQAATPQPAASEPAAITASVAERWPQIPRRRAFLVAAAVVLAAILTALLLSEAGRKPRETLPEIGSAATGSTWPGLPPRSVAVLPFENLSSDEGDAFVAFGVAESVLHRLAGVQGLTLIARTSSFAQDRSSTDVRSIGRDLNARYLVEGSLQRSGQRLRVTSQLIDASTGAHLWSLRFDRSMDDIFAVEDEIARNIATALEVSLDNDKHPYARFGADAYLEYLQGRALLATNRTVDAERAIEHFKRAVEIAPTFAAAYAALANAVWQRALLQQTSGTGFTFMLRSDLQRERVAAAASEAAPLLDRALELDDSLGEAYVLRADLEANRGDERAEADYRRGLDLSPSYAAGHERYASYLWNQAGADHRAMPELDNAIRVDPLSPRYHYLKGAMVHAAARPPAEVEPHLLRALAVTPDYHPALQRLGIVRWQQGRFAEAVKLGEQALAVDPRAEWIRWPLAQFYLEVGDLEAARSVLLDAPEAVPPYDWLAICMYERQAGRAADLLRADPSVRMFVDFDIRAYALRDAAWASGQFAKGRRELEALPSHSPPYRDAFMTVALAQTSLALGDRPEADRLAREVPGMVDGLNAVYAGAAALTLLGRNDAALDLLEEKFAAGHRRRWWYAYERDVGFDSLRKEPRFQALAARAATHAATERQSLEHMRERGEIPRRAASPGSDAGPC